MLTALLVENFTIVKSLELDFFSGMTAFTGETGAGKSIMIDALMLALGERADAGVIRPGKKKCEIIACFEVERGSDPAVWMEENDLEFEQGSIILRRVLYKEGRSKAYINGHIFSLHKVKELSEMLVHIHGQHQHQTLLKHQTHREQLDRYAGHTALLHDVHICYKEYQKIKIELSSLEENRLQEDYLQLLEHQWQELQALNMQEGEIERLHEEHQHLHHAKDYLQTINALLQLLEGEDEPNIGQGLYQVLQRLQSLPQTESIKNCQDYINTAMIQCDETLAELKHFSDYITLNPTRLQEVEARMGLLHQTARKYHITANQLPLHCLALEEKRNSYQVTQEKITLLQQVAEKTLHAYELAAEKLRASRLHHAQKLAQELTLGIQKLGMPKGKVSLHVTPTEGRQLHGLDKVEYRVCTNPGSAAEPLHKIVSGGELSRISLAIQMITAKRGCTPTLFFDEVDVGIGGATAALVGSLLRELGGRLQVFCVTHQPQVAACAHQHFVVKKFSDENETYSNILSLAPAEKVHEIARMLGGLTITEQTRSHAKELLAQNDLAEITSSY